MAQKAQNQPTLLRLCYTAPDKLGDEMKEEIRQELARQIAAKFSQARS